MALNGFALSSAVVIPDAVEEPKPVEGSLKRRQSQLTDEGSSKRRRHSIHRLDSEDAETAGSPTSLGSNTLERRQSNHEEERKRGKRLFGNLLGTLSQQNSSSPAQKRRAEIEKKQQAKLKMQAEERDEQQRQQLEELESLRRQRQRDVDREAVRLRNDNMRAMANFLVTEAQPPIYYRPQRLTDEQATKIESNRRGAEELITKGPRELGEEVVSVSNVEGVKEAHEARESTNDEASGHRPENGDPEAIHERNPSSSQAGGDADKDHAEDGEDVVINAEEDQLIY